jgi:hypothetical protein
VVKHDFARLTQTRILETLPPVKVHFTQFSQPILRDSIHCIPLPGERGLVASTVTGGARLDSFRAFPLFSQLFYATDWFAFVVGCSKRAVFTCLDIHYHERVDLLGGYALRGWNDVVVHALL